MEGIFIKILNMSISAGWLILAVIVLRLLLKKAPKWIHVLLWGLVGVRLVMPFTIETGFSLLPSAEVISPTIGFEPAPMIHSGVTALDRAVNPAMSNSLAADPFSSANPMQIVLYIGSKIWIAGIAVLLAYALISFLKLRRRVSEAVLLNDNIWICDQVKSPFILGIIRPRIYLPSDLEENNMEYVLKHERAHLKRKDHLWKLIGFLLLAVYWFNPLTWIAYILLCRDIEMACDEKVIAGMEMSDKKAYANALVSCSMQRRPALACPLAFGEVGVKKRVKGVLHYKKPAFWIIIVAVIACIAAAACFLTDPAEQASYSYGFDIDYGSSEIYTREDMDSAIKLITETFNTWKGCELHSIRYTSDDCNSEENIEWMNDLAKGQGLDVVFTQCIEFRSDYHSPADPKQADAWNPDEEYTNWGWWLAREGGGEWHLMTFGY